MNWHYNTIGVILETVKYNRVNLGRTENLGISRYISRAAT